MTPRNGLRLLPLLNSGPHGSRSSMTCHYRCGNACDKPVPNTSDNPHFSSLVEGALARRSVLKAGGVGAGALVLGGLLNPSAAAAATPAPAARRAGAAAAGIGSADFTPVAPNVRDNVTVPRGYTYDVLVRWGDPVTADAPAFDAFAQTPASAERQFGYNCDYVGVVPLTAGSAVLVANNEYTDEELMFPAGVYDDATVKKIAMASHGMSVVQIERGRKPRLLEAVEPPRRPAQPPDHREHAVPRRRPRRRHGAAPHQRRPVRQERPRHLRQLRRRHHALGHDPVRRGELQRLLRQVGHARQPVRRLLRPLRPRR